MSKLNPRILIGGSLLLFGGLLFLEQLGILKGASSLFWSFAFIAFGASFLGAFFMDMKDRWWAVIPGFVFVGLGVEGILPAQFESFSGSVFLGALSLAFWFVYISDRSRWWGIIPGGVLATLAVLTNLDEVSGVATGGVFFIGLGLTFLLVAVLPNTVGRMNWAYIPATVLVLLGVFIGNEAAVGMMQYLMPAALVVVGLALIAGYFMQRD